ncbi:CaiB/BaiF CoA transferase family protein [Nocardia fusca]|uniref:CaiB/BaiF CoA transferase family protein n=1 Tax=Nocardia fusca TaxID=941183 RepID=UPI00378795E3
MTGTTNERLDPVSEGPLTGVKVLELSMWVFGPACAAILGQMGADVIKVEHPEGGDPQRILRNKELTINGVSPWVQIANRGKRSIGLDVKKPEGRAILSRLVAEADVFVTSFLPEARRKLRIEVDDIRADNPSIIYARASGLGQAGPERERGGFDLPAGWGRGGTAFKLTPEGGEPPMMPASFYDLNSSVALAGAISMALFRRERSGTPSVIDAALLHTAMWPLSPDIAMAPKAGGMHVIRDRRTPGNPTTNWYRTKDDRWLYLAHLQSDRYWPELCRTIGAPQLLEDERFTDHAARVTNQRECVAALDEIFARRTLAEWTPILNRTEGVWAPVQSPAELYDDPQVRANGWLTPVDGLDMSLVAPPFQFDDLPPAPASPAPEAGQHTEEILLELGMSWEEIIAKKESGAIQ